MHLWGSGRMFEFKILSKDAPHHIHSIPGGDSSEESKLKNRLLLKIITKSSSQTTWGKWPSYS